jgi:anti-sigma factor RsiW
MNHSEAVEQMAVERYLLGEFDADAREDFEEHMFGCPECALDARVATVFIEEAKSELGRVAPSQPEVKSFAKKENGRSHWLVWLRPAFAAPVFAALVMLIGYQNLVTLPSLRKAATQPAIIPVAPLSGGTRGENRTTVAADRVHGLAVPVDIPLDPAIGTFVSYSFELYNPQGKLAWSGTIPAPAQSSTGDLQFSFVVRGGMLKSGTYRVSISGTGAHGETTPIENYVFNVAPTN